MEAVDFDTLRKRLHEALSDILDEEDSASTVIAGWVLVFEGVHPDDERTLTVLTADATGEQRLSPWQGEGYLRHVAAHYDDYDYYGGLDEEEDD
jgi:hypothetical protein